MISATEPIYKPHPVLIKASSNTGNKAVADTEAAICTNGCKISARHGFRPIATPTGTVADAIVQTLTNWVSNAIKFSPAHSTIYLSAPKPDRLCAVPS